MNDLFKLENNGAKNRELSNGVAFFAVTPDPNVQTSFDRYLINEWIVGVISEWKTNDWASLG